MEKLFEKLVALTFLFLLVGIVGFLTYTEMPSGSEKPILMVLGGLMAVAATALPKLFGTGDREKDELKSRIRHLESALQTLSGRYEVLEGHYDEMMKMLIDRHVVEGKGVAPAKQSVS